MDQVTFLNSQLEQDAVIRNFKIIGEAINKRRGKPPILRLTILSCHYRLLTRCATPLCMSRGRNHACSTRGSCTPSVVAYSLGSKVRTGDSPQTSKYLWGCRVQSHDGHIQYSLKVGASDIAAPPGHEHVGRSSLKQVLARSSYKSGILGFSPILPRVAQQCTGNRRATEASEHIRNK